MAPPRRFDWDEARRLRAEGWTLAALAERFGVTDSAIHFACNDEARARMHRRSAQDFEMVCEDCGGRAAKNCYSPHDRPDRVVCRACSNARMREEALLRRMDSDGNLRCSECGCYRPMAEYVMKANGSPRHDCRACQTARRTAWRHANRERDRANDRAAKRRKKAAAA